MRVCVRACMYVYVSVYVYMQFCTVYCIRAAVARSTTTTSCIDADIIYDE